MNRSVFRLVTFTAPFVIAIAMPACGEDSSDSRPDGPSQAPDGPATPDGPPAEAPPAVYVLSNEVDANRVVVYHRAADGSLTAGDAYATGGTGSAAGLGSQGALVYEPAQRRFFAVNAGDASISMLRLTSDGALEPESTVASGGVKPVSITVSGSTVYVVNAGDPTSAGNISGFEITGGALVPIAGSTRPLSDSEVGPAQIQFSPGGTTLVVTEKATNLIDTYAVTGGVASSPTSQASVGATPFGFAFSGAGQLLVSEAFGGELGMGAASSYAMTGNGELTPISSSIGSGQAAPCWLVVAHDHAYVTNTRTNNITSYAIATDGTLALDAADGISATAGMGPIDADVSDGDEFLYVLNSRDHSIGIYAVAADGGLTPRPELIGVSPTAVGVIAR